MILEVEEAEVIEWAISEYPNGLPSRVGTV